MRSSERVNPKESRDFHNFCTGEKDSTQGGSKTGGKSCPRHILRTTRRVSRMEADKISARADTEAFKLEKRSLGGSCEARKPFEEPCPRMRTPWPGLISRFHWLNT